MSTESADDIEQALQGRVRRLNAGVHAMVLGLFVGLGLFAATLWLVLKGGQTVGPHLELLGYYFPGYRVTWAGAFIGLGYGLLTGLIVGYATARLYNALARLRR